MHILLPMLKHIGVDTVGIAMYLQVISMDMSDRNANRDARRDEMQECLLSPLSKRRPIEQSGQRGRDIFLYLSTAFSPVLYHRKHPLSREKRIL